MSRVLGDVYKRQVVSVSITAFSLALIQRIYRRYGTIEMRELLERAKKEDD